MNESRNANESTNEIVGREVITSDDVQTLVREGNDRMVVGEGAIITHEAKEAAERLGVMICKNEDPDPDSSEKVTEKLQSAQIEPDDIRDLNVETRSDAVICGGQVVVPGEGIIRADIAIKDGSISALGADLSTDGLQIDAAGLYVMPAVFDPHVHMGLFAPLRQEIASEGESALSGGVTAVGCFMGGEGSHDGRLRELDEAVQAGKTVDVIPHLVIGDRTQLSEVDEYIRLGIRSFKIYMCGLPGLIEPIDDAFMADVFEKLRPYRDDVTICIHAENAALVNRARGRLQDKKNEIDLKRWADAHPAFAEKEAIMRASLLADYYGVSVYFVHVSSMAGIEAVRSVRQMGCDVHAETTSPYLTAPPSGSNEVLGKMSPPLRGEDTADGLWKAIKDGVIDTVGTDNVTMTKEEKGTDGDFWDVIPGYPALATHLPILLHEGYNRRNVDLMRISELSSKRPAEIFGVYPQKGSLVPGSDADLIAVDPNLKRTVDPAELGSRSDFSILQGRTINGWPMMTMKNGRVVSVFGKKQEFAPGRLLI